MRNLAIIPARSGSKSLPDKNIKLLCGVPLMAYSIKAAIESELFSEIMVSTDSEVYARVAKEHGAKVPFLRSPETSGDKAGSWEVVKEVLDEYSFIGEIFDTVCLLQPTSPLRLPSDIVDAYRLFEEKDADNVIGICEADHSPLWMNVIPEDLSMDTFVSEKAINANRQQLETYYRINGAMYIRRVSLVLRGDSVYRNSIAYVMPRERSVDIDMDIDFVIAEALMNAKGKERKEGIHA